MDDLTGWDIDLPPVEGVSISDVRNSPALVLSGGGMKGCYLLGALQYLYDQTRLEHVRSFYGTSIGGVIGALLIIGYTPIEIFVYIVTHKVQESLGQFNRNIFERKCLMDPSAMIRFLTDMIVHKIGSIPTLGELKERFRRDLTVVSVARDRITEPLYFSTRTHPDLSLIQVLHMTISIPFVFGYAAYDGRKYIDGGLIDNFPILHASEREPRVFGLDLRSPEGGEADDLSAEFMAVVTAPMTHITESHKRRLKGNASYLDLTTCSEIAVNFSQTSGAMYEMFVNGFRQVRHRLKCKTD